MVNGWMAAVWAEMSGSFGILAVCVTSEMASGSSP
jgi:hypothetical protein